MDKKYLAVMRNGEHVLTTVEADDPNGVAYIRGQRDRWALHYTNDMITIASLKRRAQSAQVSSHGRTEARGWEFSSG